VWVRWRFAHKHFGLRIDRRFHRTHVTGLDLMGHDTKSRQMLDTKLAAAVIALIEKNDLVARRKLAHEQSDDRCHAA